MTDDLGSRIVFDVSSCEIQDPAKRWMIGQGRRIGNLYVLDVQVSPVRINAVVDISLWHKRFGHPSYSRLDTISTTLGTMKHKNKGVAHCRVCHLAKQKKLSFSSQNNVCTSRFQMIHIDIWGPFSVETLDGFKYFFTIVDDHSRATWIYLLRTKSDVLHVFPAFINKIETQYNEKIKSVRRDNAPELKFDKLFREKGIVSYLSCPETPEQNSVVERKHQRLLNVARALMFQSQVPL